MKIENVRRAFLSGSEPSPHRAFLAVELPSGKEPPKEFRLFSAGTVKTTKGEFLFSERSQREVLARSKEWGNRHSMDWEHRALFAAMSGDGRAPASAWYDLEVRAGALWASNVEWTKQGSEDVLGKSYRYISPAFDYDADTLEIVELINASLTNLPATRGMDPLLASHLAGGANRSSKGVEKMELKALIAMLGLPANSTEAEVLAHLSRTKDFRAAVLSTSGRTSEAEALAALSAGKADAERASKLQGEIDAMKAAGAKNEVDALLSQGEKEGKIPPGSDLRKYLSTQSADQVKAFLAVAPKVAPGKVGQERSGSSGTTESNVDATGALALSAAQEIALARLSAEMDVPADKIRKTWLSNMAIQKARQTKRDNA